MRSGTPSFERTTIFVVLPFLFDSSPCWTMVRAHFNSGAVSRYSNYILSRVLYAAGLELHHYVRAFWQVGAVQSTCLFVGASTSSSSICQFDCNVRERGRVKEQTNESTLNVQELIFVTCVIVRVFPLSSWFRVSFLKLSLFACKLVLGSSCQS